MFVFKSVAGMLVLTHPSGAEMQKTKQTRKDVQLLKQVCELSSIL